MLTDAEKSKVAGGQQNAVFIRDVHGGLTGTAAPMAYDGPGGHYTAAGGADEINASVQGDIISAVSPAGAAAGTVSHRIVCASVEQAVGI